MKYKEALNKFLAGDSERVGFILKSGEIVEATNVCPDPRNGFLVSGDDLLKYSDDAVATWHTHPNGSRVLSSEDYIGFQNYPDMKHYIVAPDGVECYVVKDGEVLIDE